MQSDITLKRAETHAIRRGEIKMSNNTNNESNPVTTQTSAYETKATTTKIVATSRASVKIGDNFYTVEMSEERAINPNSKDVDVAKEQQLLWDSVNESVDNQIIDIKNAFAKR